MTIGTCPHGLPFTKMHGLGNDFIIIDERRTGPVVDAALVRAMADRHQGVGCDQMVAIRDTPKADLALAFWNADGSTAGACGNATRCVAALEMAAHGHTRLTLMTAGRGPFTARRQGALLSVNMGHPFLDARDVPLARNVDTLRLPISGAPVATGMGNPHCTFFVDNADTVDLAARGSEMEHHPLYPDRTNVQFAHVIGPDHLRVRVWERGVGVTLASGSSACAAVVGAARRGLTGRAVRVRLDGGSLEIDWRADGVWMTGPAAHVFDGVWRAGGGDNAPHPDDAPHSQEQQSR